MIKFKNKFLQGEFDKNVLTLMLGTTISQAIPIAISPILTRIYTPEDFGVIALFITISTIIASIANGRYELAIMLPIKEENAINIFALGFIITTVFSLVIFIIVVFFYEYLIVLLKNKQLGFWLYFMPLVVFLLGLYNNLNFFNNRNMKYKDISRSRVIKTITSSIIQLVLGFLIKGSVGLFTGQIVSNFFANGILLKNIIRNKSLLAKINKQNIVEMAIKYIKFPKFSILAALLNTISLQSINLLIAVFYNTTILGFYSLVIKIISLPTFLIAGSIGQVFFQEATNEFNKKGNTQIIFIKTLKKLLFIALPLFTFMFFIIEPVFAFVYGENWSVAGFYAKILTPLAFVRFISSTLSSIPTIHQKLKINLNINIILLVTIMIIFYLGNHFKVRFENILIAYSLILSLEYLLFLISYNKISKKILKR